MNIWSRLGISVALVATFCVTMLEVFQDKSYYDTYKWYICGVFLAAGVVLGLVGRSVNRARRLRYQEMRNDNPDQHSDEEEEDGVDPSQPFLLVNMAYWGVMLLTFGLIIIFIVPTYKKTQPVLAREPQKTNAPAPATNAVVAPTNAPVAPAQPPSIKLQGLVYRQPNPSVLINGRTYFVGESFENAQLIQINPGNAVFEWEGRRIVLPAPE